MSTKISLRHRWMDAPALIEVDGQYLSLRLPRYFGARWWRIPLDEVSVVDHESAEPAEHAESDFFFPDGLSIPYLATASPRAWPNLSLLFTTRQRVPPLRLRASRFVRSPFGYRSSRSAPGDLVDGVQLHVADPRQGVRALANAGLEVVWRPVTWLREHRWTCTDLDQLAAYRTAPSPRPSRRAWAMVVALLAGLVLIPDKDADSFLSKEVTAACIALALAVPPGVRRLDNRCSADQRFDA